MLLDLYATSLNDVVEAVKPIPETAMLLQPPGLANHPAWILSHLAHAAPFIALLLDEPGADVGEHDMTRFGLGYS